MPKISTKKRADGQEQSSGNIFDHFGLEDPAQKGKKASDSVPEPTTAELLAQIKALNERVDKTSQVNRDLLTVPYVQTNQNDGDNTNQVPELDLSGLPDPVTQSNEYAKELSRRTLAHIQAQNQAERQRDQAQQTQQQDLNQRVEGLWSEFRIANPELAKNEDLVAFVAQKVANEARAKGIDVERYMFGPGRKQYLSDVAEKMNSILPPPVGDEEDEAPAPVEAQRTTGIFGGQETGGKPNKTAPQQGQTPTMTKDLQDMQRASGLF